VDEYFWTNRNPETNEPQPAQLYLRQGDAFTEYGLPFGNFAGHGVIPTDLDRDGDVDLVVTVFQGELWLLENEAPRSACDAWIGVTLEGREGNTRGIGASVELLLDDGTLRKKLVGSQGIAHTSLPLEVHFGLGRRTVERLIVGWPSGAVTQMDRPELGRTVSVSE
jgi:hypothetical protein